MSTVIQSSFQDPVTLETFTYPKVLPCGHTLDKKSILKLTSNKCPLCNHAIQKSIRQCPTLLPTNWSIVQALQLSVPDKTHDHSIYKRVHETAQRIQTKFIEECVLISLKYIEQQSQLGHLSCYLSEKKLCLPKSPLIRKSILDSVAQHLRQLKFQVNTVHESSCWPWGLGTYALVIYWSSTVPM